jgi:four helix bundle protein
MLNIEGDGAEAGELRFGEAAVQYDLEGRLLEFAAGIIRLVEQIPTTRAGNHVAGQILRSGTSPLPNHGEAQAAESRNDFVHKLSISLKELRETHRWLRLIKRVPLIEPPGKIDALLDETGQLIKIFATSIRTALSKK